MRTRDHAHDRFLGIRRAQRDPGVPVRQCEPARVVVERRRDASRELRRLAKEEFVAVAQRSPVHSAERAAQIRRAASEDLRDVDASGERDVGTTPGFGPGESERDAGGREHGTPAAQRHRVDRRSEVGAADRDQRRLRRTRARVRSASLRGPPRFRRCRRAGWRGEAPLCPSRRRPARPSAACARGRGPARSSGARHSRLARSRRPIPEVGLRDGAEANAISCREQGRLRARDVEDGQRRLADQIPSARRIERIHAGLAAADADGARRYDVRGVVRRGVASVGDKPPRYAKPGMNPTMYTR